MLATICFRGRGHLPAEAPAISDAYNQLVVSDLGRTRASKDEQEDEKKKGLGGGGVSEETKLFGH